MVISNLREILLLLLSLPTLNTSYTIPSYSASCLSCHRRNLKERQVTNVSFKKSKKSRLFNNYVDEPIQDGKPSVSITGISPAKVSFSSSIDYILSFLVSDIGSISLGLIGLFICMYNRLSSIDLDSTLLESGTTNAMGVQSRTDLLAVIASGSVLLNGVSKLDVTSALASSVVLEGNLLEKPLFVESWMMTKPLNPMYFQKISWALNSFLTLVRTAVLIGHDGKQWTLLVLTGIIPHTLNNNGRTFSSMSTPILDKFLKSSKETYLPTLQSLPGKSEFFMLPPNTQEVLLLPAFVSNNDDDDDVLDKENITFVVALASDTAKSLTPRDIAWCQVIVNRLGIDLKSLMMNA